MSYSIGDYPLPKHAAYIWHDGKGLRLGLPGFDGARGHSVHIPLDRLQPLLTPSGSVAAGGAGIVQLLQLLQARASADAQTREHIGRSSAITQDQLERAMQTAKRYDAQGLPEVINPDDLGI